MSFVFFSTSSFSSCCSCSSLLPLFLLYSFPSLIPSPILLLFPSCLFFLLFQLSFSTPLPSPMLYCSSSCPSSISSALISSSSSTSSGSIVLFSSCPHCTNTVLPVFSSSSLPCTPLMQGVCKVKSWSYPRQGMVVGRVVVRCSCLASAAKGRWCGGLGVGFVFISGFGTDVAGTVKEKEIEKGGAGDIPRHLYLVLLDLRL